jgi:hypothetical protein
VHIQDKLNALSNILCLRDSSTKLIAVANTLYLKLITNCYISKNSIPTSKPTYSYALLQEASLSVSIGASDNKSACKAIDCTAISGIVKLPKRVLKRQKRAIMVPIKDTKIKEAAYGTLCLLLSNTIKNIQNINTLEFIIRCAKPSVDF